MSDLHENRPKQLTDEEAVALVQTQTGGDPDVAATTLEMLVAYSKRSEIDGTGAWYIDGAFLRALVELARKSKRPIREFVADKPFEP